MVRPIDAQAVQNALLQGDEIALIDTREEGAFGASHILRAVNIPLSRLDLDLPRLAPNRTVPLYLTDDDADRLTRAARTAEGLGYTNIRGLEGGSKAWADAGFELFSGLNVPSKVFGEYIEHTYDTPRITATELKQRMDAGEKIVVLDSRPMDEYHAMNIPTGIDVPGAELVYRAREVVPDDDTLVVVNCAGRTRSIIGCQSLVNAGLPNKVVALENGTMGWYLAGLQLEKGSSRTAPDPSPETLAWARDAARKVSDRFGVSEVDAATVASWQADPGRTTYVIDVRTPEEYAAGHLAGAVHAPGGQLVQATDRYVAVQNARIVLVDDVEVRARMTASWLVQMGWPDVHVLAGGMDNATGGQIETGSGKAEVSAYRRISAADAMAMEDALILDLSTSLQHRRGHIKGSRWIIRSRLAEDLDPALASGRAIIVSSRDDRLSQAACGDVAALGHKTVHWIGGGHGAWVEAGGETETGLDSALSPTEDLYYRPYDREHGVEQAMKAYLDWEIALVEQLKRDGTLNFPRFDQAGQG